MERKRKRNCPSGSSYSTFARNKRKLKEQAESVTNPILPPSSTLIMNESSISNIEPLHFPDISLMSKDPIINFPLNISEISIFNNIPILKITELVIIDNSFEINITDLNTQTNNSNSNESNAETNESSSEENEDSNLEEVYKTNSNSITINNNEEELIEDNDTSILPSKFDEAFGKQKTINEILKGFKDKNQLSKMTGISKETLCLDDTVMEDLLGLNNNNDYNKDFLNDSWWKKIFINKSTITNFDIFIILTKLKLKHGLNDATLTSFLQTIFWLIENIDGQEKPTFACHWKTWMKHTKTNCSDVNIPICNKCNLHIFSNLTYKENKTPICPNCKDSKSLLIKKKKISSKSTIQYSSIIQTLKDVANNNFISPIDLTPKDNKITDWTDSVNGYRIWNNYNHYKEIFDDFHYFVLTFNQDGISLFINSIGKSVVATSYKISNIAMSDRANLKYTFMNSLFLPDINNGINSYNLLNYLFIYEIQYLLRNPIFDINGKRIIVCLNNIDCDRVQVTSTLEIDSHSSKRGLSCCLNSGVAGKNKKGNTIQLYNEPCQELRNLYHYIKEAIDENKTLSPFALLYENDGFDLIQNCAKDFMHLILNCSKKIWETLFKPEELKTMDSYLKNSEFPSFIGRIFTKISCWKQFKYEEHLKCLLIFTHLVSSILNNNKSKTDFLFLITK